MALYDVTRTDRTSGPGEFVSGFVIAYSKKQARDLIAERWHVPAANLVATPLSVTGGGGWILSVYESES